MAPKKKRTANGTKSNRKARSGVKPVASTSSHKQTSADDNTTDEKDDSSANIPLQTGEYGKLDNDQQSIDCPEHNEKENIDFEELLSVSTINSSGIKLEDEFMDSALHLSQTQNQAAEKESEINESMSKLSNLNLTEDTEKNGNEQLDMIINESNVEVFNDGIHNFTDECVSEELIMVASEQEIESANTTTTTEDNPIIDDSLLNDLEQIKIEETQNTQTFNKTEKKPKINKKSIRSGKTKSKSNKKKVACTVKTNKKEKISKIKEKKPNNKTKEKDNLDISRRRSSRLKTISELKQNQVKLKANDSDASENSNSGPTDLEKPPTDCVVLSTAPYESEQKPVKVKSRWRRSSELESVNSKNNSTECDQGSEQDLESEKILTNSEEIKKRLKQFVHLKENQYLTGRVTCKEAKKMACDCVLTTEEIEKGELGCGEDCLNRLLLIECGTLCPVGDKCTNKRFQKSQFSPCEVFRTDKKGLGIRATGNIKHGEFILEYVGEVIGPDEFEERATEYSKDKNPHYYFMSLRSDAVIDATQKGNISRFINHSCDPNAETQKWTVNGELRIGFFSKRTIIAGEEITFDYQFQRYGKEAQKCFCESNICRGWLGEEPEEEEEEDEEEEEEGLPPVPTETVVTPVIEKVVEEQTEQITLEKQPPLPSSEIIVNEPQLPVVKEVVPENVEPAAVVVTESPSIQVKPPLVKKEKKKFVKRKILKDIFEDVDVDEELEMLVSTGLKNQAQTLKLSRLMVRATEVSQRITLLRVLRRGEFPCRRLFLDYHGLRLIHGWMNEAQQLCATDEKQEALRLGLLQTLVTLPIPNKTMLQDSKVLPTVELWSKKLVDVPREIDSESNSPKLENETNISEATENKVETSVLQTISKNEQEIKKEAVQEEPFKLDLALTMPGEIFEIRRSVGMDIENIRSENLWRAKENNEKLVQDIIDMFDEDMDISPISFNESYTKPKVEEKKDERDYEFEIMNLALKLLEEWSVLKEVFRIPKKERIEQMKEHEREADKGYKEHYSEKKSGNRYRTAQRTRSSKSKSLKPDENYHSTHTRLNKHERRKLFAMKVEQEEVERRFKNREAWKQPELPCLPVGADGLFPFDSRNFQLVWNQQTAQWQTFPIMNPNMATHSIYGMNFPYPITTNVSSVAIGLPNIPLNSQSIPNVTLPTQNMSTPTNVPPPVPNLANMSLPPPNMTHLQQNLHRPPIINNSILGMSNASQNSFASVTNLSIPTNIPPPSTMTHPTNIPPPTTNMPPPSTNIPPPTTNVPPPNMQAPSNILGHPLTPLSNTLPISNINSHLPVQQTSYNVHPEKIVETNDVSEVKFAGPIPPPVKLPQKWKCAKDKYGRPYYYHIKIRVSQWEPPELPLPVEVEEESSDSTSSSETSSLSSTSSSADSDEDELDDTKLLLGIRKKFQQLDSSSKQASSPTKESPEESKEQSDVIPEANPVSLDERLKDEFNLNKKESLNQESSSKRRRLGLVTEVHIISPRSEEDKIIAKENLRKYKENKERLKRQKELTMEQNKKRVKVTIKNNKSIRKHRSSSKTKLKEAVDFSCETAKKNKETFLSNMAGVMVGILNPYRKPDCKEGKITNTEDFKHLARKLTHFVMLKELKHCQNMEDLTCTESVKSKAKEFVRKYMSKFGEIYHKPKDDLEY